MTPIDALAWVHVRDRRLLSVRTRGKEKFYLPAANASGVKATSRGCAARSVKNWAWSSTR